ncbi:MAG: hypothetical protein JOY77_09840, partial [Alphaproteobacteria bacterium]|nr:hypothetical protein [Alphaproteobacteria bacterium]
LWGRGQYADALNAVQAGIKKGNLSKPDEAQISLGIVQLAGGQKEAALKTFAAVKSTPAAQAVGRLWSVYARSGGTGTLAANTAAQQPSGGRKHH